MNTQVNKAKQVKQELKAAGAGAVALLKPESRFLHKLIGDDEHIKSVVYGRSEKSSSMLVATDRRVLFLDRQLRKTLSSEFPYDTISSVKFVAGNLSGTILLETTTKNITLNLVSPASGDSFAKFVSSRISLSAGANQNNTAATGTLENKVPKNGIDFLTDNSVGVLSTVDKNGKPSAAAVFYTIYNGYIYIVSKSNTTKVKNTQANRQVALTVFDQEKLKTLQLQGIYGIEEDRSIKTRIFEEILQPKLYSDGEKRLPPITKLSAGEYVALRIVPTSANYYDFS